MSSESAPLKAFKAFSALVVAIVPIVLPDAIVPIQLDALRELATGFGILAAIAGFIYRPLPRWLISTLLAVGAVTATVVAILSIQFLAKIPVAANEVRPVLVGFSISEQGHEEIRKAGLERESTSEIVSRLGYDRVPAVWGRSYSIVLWSLAACFIALLVSTTVLITSLGLD